MAAKSLNQRANDSKKERTERKEQGPKGIQQILGHSEVVL
jgi:hypothetical protein